MCNVPTYLGMYVCMYSIYVCIYICVYVCMCVYTYTYIQGLKDKGIKVETQTRPCINKTLKRTGVWLWRTQDIQKTVINLPESESNSQARHDDDSEMTETPLAFLLG